MTEKKHVAKTLTNILDHPVMKQILDRTCDIKPVIETVSSWWRYDMEKRRPGIAYDGTTDLDLACFLYELSERNAVINIPHYKSLRAGSRIEGERIISKDNRHGSIIGLSANKEVFSFSLRVKDMNVMTTNSVGEFRNFSVTDLDGNWYDGLSKIEFMPTAKENEFIRKYQLAVGNTITFKHFVSPNRWVSLYGQYYFMTKALIERLREESQYYYQEVKAMLVEGLKYPEEKTPTEYPDRTKEPGKKIKVKSLEVELDYPTNKSLFPKYAHTVENLVKLTDLRKWFVYGVVPKLTFATRTVEYAYYKYGQDKLPSWIQNVDWEENYVSPGKRKVWDRLVLFQPKVGEIGVSIKKRIMETTQEVSLDY